MDVPSTARDHKFADAGSLLSSGDGQPERPPFYAKLDRRLHGLQGQFTGGVSPISLALAGWDWGAHFANAPFRRAHLAREAWNHAGRMAAVWWGLDDVRPAPGDHRFADPNWRLQPFRTLMQGFLLAQDWMEEVTDCPPGVDRGNARIVRFLARQWLDMFSPSNIPWANPEVIAETWAQGGRNLLQGAANAWADMLAAMGREQGDRPLQPGHQLAVTPGKVVFRNRLIELIQYAPATGEVHAEPVLITPAWIMKYYILDLSPHNSLIRYLTEQGHTVFCISWRNPDTAMRDTSFDAYRTEGFMKALDVVERICGDVRVHVCGYCLGGTLLAIAAAAMARDGDDRLASVTLLAAQTDFTDAGELELFVTEAQIAFLEDVMDRQGYLDGRQMGGAFQLLRSRDLIWSRMLKEYWLGRREQPNDLMTWNEDATRMPARMHSEYLSGLFLRDDLAEGRYMVEGRAVAVSDIREPIFVVGTETDHVAPWRSVYKIHLLNPGEIRFVLTSGGHNAGIVSEPGHPRRHFYISTRAPGTPFVGPDEWLEQASYQEGSWWPAWTEWLAEHSGPRDQPPPPMGAPRKGLPVLGDAPGDYVLEH